MACAAASAAASFSGRVVRVLDGDTLEVLEGATPRRVRLHGVDCPERNQPYGSRARQFTAQLAFGRTVTVVIRDRDRYGRLVGEVLLPDGRNLNRELLAAGYAWWYRRYSRDLRLAVLEWMARWRKRGLWQDPHPVPPWEWRKRPKSAEPVSPAMQRPLRGTASFLPAGMPQLVPD
jgi:endonuclease YncB( thermonuclease family)